MTLRFSAMVVTAVAASTLYALPAAAEEAPPAPDLERVQTKKTKLGTSTWYRQTFKGLPVIDGYYVVHELKEGDDKTVDGRQPVPAELGVQAAAVIESKEAISRAKDFVKDAREKFEDEVEDLAPKSAKVTMAPAALMKNREFVPEFGKGKAGLAVYKGKLVWDVRSLSSTGATQTFVDTKSGNVIDRRTVSKNVNGTGLSFYPNPVKTRADRGLADYGDANYAKLNNERKWVKLPRLIPGRGLVGAWANVKQANVPVANRSNNTYNFPRANDQFEQVSAYYATDLAQARIQTLGWGSSYNYESQDLRINTFSADNSFFTSWNDSLNFGTGGVDDAEDLEVVWHEYGHAMMDDMVPDYGWDYEAAAIGEGFGDYWAASLSAASPYARTNPACVMDWDARPSCLRKLNTGKTYANLGDGIHLDGEIWSGALWSIRQSIGRFYGDDAALLGMVLFTPDITMHDAADCTVQAFEGYYPERTGDANVIRQAFAARGLSGGSCF